VSHIVQTPWPIGDFWAFMQLIKMAPNIEAALTHGVEQ
jgi:hypothetical protein